MHRLPADKNITIIAHPKLGLDELKLYETTVAEFD